MLPQRRQAPVRQRASARHRADLIVTKGEHTNLRRAREDVFGVLHSSNHLGTKMSHRFTAVLILGATMCSSVAPAYSGPCSSEISQFESAVRQSAGNPNAGPTLPQSVGAQLGHQPTPGAMKRAEKQAQRMFERALARAKRLDGRGDRAGCTRALADAEDMYTLH